MPTQPQKKYIIEANINGEDFKIKTDDLRDTLIELDPKHVKSKAYFTFSTGTKSRKVVRERVLLVHQAKMLWRNKITMEVFIRNLQLT